MSLKTKAQAKAQIWPLPRAAENFNRLEVKEQLKMVEPHLIEFNQDITAFIFLFEMCVVLKYSKDKGHKFELTSIGAISKEEGLYRVKNESGAKYMWHYLEPNRKSKIKINEKIQKHPVIN